MLINSDVDDFMTGIYSKTWMISVLENTFKIVCSMAAFQ